jgi:hypothetical protein
MFVGYFTFGRVHAYYAMDATPIYQAIHLPKTNKEREISNYLSSMHMQIADFKNISR